MCGIAGFFDTSLNQEDAGRTLRAMCDAIIHRGPDQDGYLVENGCAIGMRRLSIIDLSTGKQPISNEDKRYWIVFNGEVYDYPGLRRELIQLGHSFRTHSDTETIVHCYEQWGVKGLERLRGMYAFALWDRQTRSILLARDRVGKKPLYYTVRGNKLYFASELKCFRAAGLPLEMDREALRWYFQMGHVPDPFTAYQGVRKLPPGGWLRFHASGKVEEGRYWRMPVPVNEAPASMSRVQACDRVRELFDEAVRIRMVADVPVGAFLSGGIDSSLVVATMARLSQEPVRTFSIGFEEAKFDETKYARMVAEQYKTQHHEIIVKPDSISMVDRIVDSFDEPFADPSAIPTYYLCEFAARQVKVALSGDGGDEFFNGYEAFFEIGELSKWDRVPRWMRAGLGAVGALAPYAAYGKNYVDMVSRQTSFDRYISRYLPAGFRDRLLQPSWRTPGTEELIRQLPDTYVGDGHDPLTEAVFFEATEKLTGDILVKVDRMSMACSLEVRGPLLDHKLVEFALTLPHHWKQDQEQGRWRGKTVLLDALGDRLPPALLTRPKAGFGVPLDAWFRTSLRGYLNDHLLSRDFLGRGIVQESFLRGLIDEHQRERRNHGYFLWSMLMLAVWLRRFESGASQKVA
jgi:asparagine synthase (glutamine-hydrolysing)